MTPEAQTKLILTAETLRTLVRYYPATGDFTWRRRPLSMFRAGKRWSAKENQARWNTRFAEKPALNCSDETGYKSGRIFRVLHRAHRVAFLYQLGRWPTGTVDHINHDPGDNRWCNLREATQQENLWNTRPISGAASKYKGVHLADGLWLAAITVNGNSRRLGTYTSEEDAAVAYDLAALNFRGDFAFLNFPDRTKEYLERLSSGASLVKPRNSATGIKGVRQLPGGRFRAYRKKDGKQVSLGCYDTAQEAHKAYADDLKEAGHTIEDRWVKANGKRFKEYRLGA